MIQRRGFLSMIGAGGAAATIAAWPKSAQAVPKPPITIYPQNWWHRSALPASVQRRVLVVGGGLAGLSAALELAERGYDVVVREAGPELGGRLATRRYDLATGSFAVEHGLHMWFDNYLTFRDIRDRLGINGYFRPYNQVDFVFRDYEPERLESSPPIWPLNALGIIERSPNLDLGHAIGSFNALPELMFYNHHLIHGFDDRTFEQWRQQRNVDQTFYDVLLQPAASVTLNDPQTVSAAEMLHYMHYYFIGQPRAMNREVTTVDHATAVIDPWAQRLANLGVQIQLSHPVPGLRFFGGRAVGEVGSNETFDWVVLACDVPGAKAVLQGSIALDPGSAAALAEAQAWVGLMNVAPPYKILRVWFDGALDPSRPEVIETPQHHPINLVAQFNRLELESAQWAAQSGGCILEFHLYADPMWANAADDEVWPIIAPTALEILPELGGMNILAQTVGSYANFTSFEVGQWLARPEVDFARELGLSNLFACGDWIHTNFPSALMERAVVTGRLAANEILLADSVRQATVRAASPYGPGLI